MFDDPISRPVDPLRVSYATGRMLGVEDFQAEQTYHRGRLARVLSVAVGTGTVSGLKVQSNDAPKAENVELQVTPGVAIDRAGRVIDVPYTVCIRVKRYLDQQLTDNPQDVINAFKVDGIVADVFVSFVACDRGKTPSFASMDDYDATDAFAPNRLLDSFAMLLVLRRDPNPRLPQDPWQKLGANPTVQTIRQHLLDADAGPAVTPVEYPSDPEFDRTSVFLARVKIAATQSGPGAKPAYDLTKKIDINNTSRLFVYPAAVVARQAGLTTGEG
jgi:hypothetical protein